MEILGNQNDLKIFSKDNENRGYEGSIIFNSGKITISNSYTENPENNSGISFWEKGIIGEQEFNKQGDRLAFAQLADVQDFYQTISGYNAGATQTLKNISGVLTWVTD